MNELITDYRKDITGVTDRGALKGFKRDPNSGAFLLQRTVTQKTQNKRVAILEDKVAYLENTVLELRELIKNGSN